MIRVLFLILIVTLISCKPKTEPIASALDNYFSKEFTPNAPGAAILVMKGEQIVFSKGYGIADIKTKEAITPQTIFNIGSVSKTFVSNTILSLAEENKLSLNDSIYKYFPDFKNKAIAQKVKIHHLLSHTSGLIDNRRKLMDSVLLHTAKDEGYFAPIKQNDSLHFEPGSHWNYSNPAYNGLALIIEKVTGKRWQDVVIERIFQSSGMANSKITDGAYPEEGVAHAYIRENNETEYIEYDNGEEPTFRAAGNGGVWSSVEELAKYEIALRKATFLKKETIKKSRTPHTYPIWQDTTLRTIGYSWFLDKYDSLETVGHTGSQGGFRADYVSIPEKGILYIILANTPAKSRAAFLAHREKVLASLKERNWLD
jgi:CubicO group peptidase (beta-lactamase class C family)